MTILVSCLVAATAIVVFTRVLFPRQNLTATAIMSSSDEDDTSDPEPSTYFRARFAAGPGVAVYGWPAKGGIYVLGPCFGVELDFLQLDRFHPTERPSGGDEQTLADEEAHCDRMRRLGAIWWENDSAHLRWSSKDYPKGTDSFLRVGWPAGGGVWVLKTTLHKAVEKGAAMIENSYNMEERCRAIEQLGGIFYADPKKCPDLNLP